MRESLSVILPMYNEEASIINVICDIVSYVRKYAIDFVINYGSTDSSSGILNEIKMLYPEFKLISYERNQGYGFAIRKGIELAQNEWFLIMDSDGQFTIEDFGPFWRIGGPMILF